VSRASREAGTPYRPPTRNAACREEDEQHRRHQRGALVWSADRASALSPDEDGCPAKAERLDGTPANLVNVLALAHLPRADDHPSDYAIRVRPRGRKRGFHPQLRPKPDHDRRSRVCRRSRSDRRLSQPGACYQQCEASTRRVCKCVCSRRGPLADRASDVLCRAKTSPVTSPLWVSAPPAKAAMERRPDQGKHPLAGSDESSGFSVCTSPSDDAGAETRSDQRFTFVAGTGFEPVTSGL
jgi:hypothetical protein